jgi:plasmid stabilization system protein ParE
MRYQVEITPQADADLAQIVSYIAKDDPLTAEAFGMELLDQALMLSTLPYRGSRMRGNPRARKLVYGKYLIVYTVDEAATLRSGFVQQERTSVTRVDNELRR